MIELVKMQEILSTILTGERVTVDDGVDMWIFDKTPSSHEKEVMGRQFISVAYNLDQNYLYRLASEPLSLTTKLFFLDERGSSMHDFSLSELINKKDIFKLTAKMREGKITTYQSFIDQYAACPGCLYWIASELALAVYDERGTEELEKVSLQLFKDFAENGDVRACHELANHYYFNTGDKEEVIKWRRLAIEGGETEELKQLADFIIDEYPVKIDLALETLHTMQQYQLHEDWALWKEGSIYMNGTGGIGPDPARAILLTQRASDFGHASAKSTLAFYYYEGMGVPRDLHKALQLLTEANEASRDFISQYRDHDEEEEEPVEGEYDDMIAKIKQELNMP